MSAILPRATIPDDWALKSRCPLCGAAPLHVHREPDLPDRLACARCGSAFLVEQGGSRICFTDLPAALLEHREEWMTFAAASALARQAAVHKPAASPPRRGEESLDVQRGEAAVKQAQPEAQTVSSSAQLPAAPIQDEMPTPGAEKPLSDDEVWQRALRLYELGNTLARIEMILREAGNVSPAQIEAARRKLEEIEHQRLARQNRSLKIAAGIILGLLLCILATVALSLWLR
ncbi:MAG: hypothetical protein HPY45_16910 [Anaerolineae bacterium]|nr:hypothetical protein [Anaerolineae bacterium]